MAAISTSGKYVAIVGNAEMARNRLMILQGADKTAFRIIGLEMVSKSAMSEWAA